MRRLVDLLAPLGLLVILGSLAWQRTGRPLPGQPEWYLFAGVALMLLHLALRFDAVSRRLGRRQMTHGAHALLLVVVALGLFAGVNYLASRRTKRWDLTKNQRHSLSDETKRFLAGLKDDVTITYFQRKAEMERARDRMQQYEGASPKVKVSYVDPLTSPGRAQELDVRGPFPMLVIQRGQALERISNDSEQDVTNALVKVTRGVKKTICFAEGEGGRDPEDGGGQGYTSAKGLLTARQYDVQKVVLMREGKVPPECTVMIVAAPVNDLLPMAVDALRSYVKGGGKALVMLEPEVKGPLPNLQGLLKEWNIETLHDVVVDVSPMGQLFQTGPLTPLALDYPYHETTKDMRGVATAFHTARSVKAGSAAVEGVTVQNLLQTAAASWSETDLTLKEPIEMNPGVDQPGPVSMGAVATIRVAAPEATAPSTTAATPAKTEGRLVALGDADFASNTLLSFQGNREFFANVVAWLAQDVDLISITPKDADDQRMQVTEQQRRDVAVIVLAVLPLFFVVLGVMSWWRRRS